MQSFRSLTALLLGVMAVALGACTLHEPPPKRAVPRGWVAWDRMEACVGEMMRAPMPVHYLMPVEEALEVLGEPHGQLRDVSALKAFARTEGSRVYYWHSREATLYLVVGRRGKAVVNMIVVDDVTNVGQEVMLTREEILSARIRAGMGVDQVYRVMGAPDRVENVRGAGGEEIDRFWYDPADRITPPVFIDVDRKTLTVVSVSTAPREKTGPPPDLE